MGRCVESRWKGSNEFNGAERQVINHADDIRHLHFTFGNFHNRMHTCTVNLSRSFRAIWVGTLNCTYNQ